MSGDIPRHGQFTICGGNGSGADKAGTTSAPAVGAGENDADLDIEEKILRRREMAHLFQWYYPEGGWGWIILLCTFVSQTLAQGLQFGFAHPLGVAIRRRFYLPSENASNQHPQTTAFTIAINDHDSDDNKRIMPIQAQHIGKHYYYLL